MVLAIPSSLDFTKCRYFTSTVYPTSSTFLCGCTAPFIRMKSRRLVIEHEVKKESRHNNKLLGISFAANQLFQVRSIPFSSVGAAKTYWGGTVHPEQEPPRVSVQRLFATALTGPPVHSRTLWLQGFFMITYATLS